MSRQSPERNVTEISGLNQELGDCAKGRRARKRVKIRDNGTVLYYTQKEVAELFRVSQGTVIKWRQLGHLEYFSPPGSNRVLYPVSSIERFRKAFTHRDEVVKQPLEISNCRPVAPEKNWRI